MAPGEIRVELGEIVGGWQEQLRAADPGRLAPWERWLAALRLESHGVGAGMSWVVFSWSPGPGLGWRWEWGRRRPPGADLRAAARAGLAHDLAHGGLTSPGPEDVRWLLPVAESIKPLRLGA